MKKKFRDIKLGDFLKNIEVNDLFIKIEESGNLKCDRCQNNWNALSINHIGILKVHFCPDMEVENNNLNVESLFDNFNWIDETGKQIKI